jgi:hypothetical protein
MKLLLEAFFFRYVLLASNLGFSTGKMAILSILGEKNTTSVSLATIISYALCLPFKLCR